MGWRFVAGATRRCRLNQGVLEVDCGYKILKFSTQLPFSTDWQLNYFESEDVAFVLRYDNDTRICIGQLTGSVLLVTHDGFFAGIASWDAPSKLYFKEVGYRRTDAGMYSIYIHPMDMRSFHAGRSTLLSEEDISEDIVDSINEDDLYMSTSLAHVLKNIEVSSDIDGTWVTDPVKYKDNCFVLE